MSLNPMVRVKAAMNRKMITLDKGLSVKSAIKLMVKKNIGSIVVTADSSNNPVGILTERDILRSIAYRRVRPETTKIEEIMSSPIFSVEQDTTLGDASTDDDKEKYSKTLGEARREICGNNNST